MTGLDGMNDRGFPSSTTVVSIISIIKKILFFVPAEITVHLQEK